MLMIPDVDAPTTALRNSASEDLAVEGGGTPRPRGQADDVDAWYDGDAGAGMGSMGCENKKRNKIGKRGWWRMEGGEGMRAASTVLEM
jgi:hypothetical protein